MLLRNYHSHTYRCGHATGTEEEMILSAINAGYVEIGISDHIPVEGVVDVFPMRIPWEQKDAYLLEMKRLKEKYKSDIQIWIGFEAEYVESAVPYYQNLLDSKDIDYLILGNHYYGQFNPEMMSGRITTPDLIDIYVQSCIKGMESGLFEYLCHPDLFMNLYPAWDDACEKAAYDLANAALRLDMPLEYNGEGIRVGIKHGIYQDGDRYRYPVWKFWEIVAKVGCKVIIGADAHKPTSFDDETITMCIEHVQKLGLNWVQKLEIGCNRAKNTLK